MVVETVSDLEEATIALHAGQRSGLPVVVSFLFHQDNKRITPEQATEAMEAEGAFGVGANCGNGVASFLPICKRLRAATRLPIWIKPNAGLPVVSDGKAVYKTTPAEFASHIGTLIEAGANFVGGCCGTNPAFIRAAAGKLI